MSDLYHIVRLANGAYSLRSESYGETFHPVVGPVAEAQSIYVEQLRLVERVEKCATDFVVWDVGLGGAANPLTFLNAVRHLRAKVRIISFDYTTEPLTLALKHADVLGYLAGWERTLHELIRQKFVRYHDATGFELQWEIHLGDFPMLLASSSLTSAPSPHAIFYDAFSPATNPAMWTLPVFSNLFARLDPNRFCVMPTYSRSTMLRVTLLNAGFFVGRGQPTGEKEETTVAANHLECLTEPLGLDWLARASRSRSAEPLPTAEYRQRPLSEHTWQALLAHPQFRSSFGPRA